MTDREILIELLAIKLFEHTPDGQAGYSWTVANTDDRKNFRNLISKAKNAEDLYDPNILSKDDA